MRWDGAFWAGMAAVLAYGAVQDTRYERGEALAKYLILAAASNDIMQFRRLLSPLGIKDDATIYVYWSNGRGAAAAVDAYKRGISRDFTAFTSFKKWCVSLY